MKNTEYNLVAYLAMSAVIVFFLGCNSNDFKGRSGKADPKPIATISPTSAEQSPEPASSSTTEAPTPEGCPKVPQDILIIDLASGWMSGLGGTIFKELLPNLIAPCLGSVTIEYHHILAEGEVVKAIFPRDSEKPFIDNEEIINRDFNNMFEKSDWNEYNQIWMLSGANGEGGDFVVSDPNFQKFISKISQSKANLFLGGGDWYYIDHVNELAKKIGLGAIFQDGSLEAEKAPLKLEKEHPIFAGVTELMVSEYPVPIIKSSTIQVIATDSAGTATKAVANLSGNYKAVLDSDLGAFLGATDNESYFENESWDDCDDESWGGCYDNFPTETSNSAVITKDVIKYLQNVIVFLAATENI